MFQFGSVKQGSMAQAQAQAQTEKQSFLLPYPSLMLHWVPALVLKVVLLQQAQIANLAQQISMGRLTMAILLLHC